VNGGGEPANGGGQRAEGKATDGISSTKVSGKKWKFFCRI